MHAYKCDVIFGTYWYQRYDINLIGEYFFIIFFYCDNSFYVNHPGKGGCQSIHIIWSILNLLVRDTLLLHYTIIGFKLLNKYIQYFF